MTEMSDRENFLTKKTNSILVVTLIFDFNEIALKTSL